MIVKIGTNAGLVWKVLSEGGKMNVKQLKKATKLIDKDLYAALGWLAKENKLAFEELDGDVFVSLVC